MPHRRTLILAPREFLLVVDWLFDRSGKQHDFRQWFQLAPGWSIESIDGSYAGTRGDASLHVIDLFGTSSANPVQTGADKPLQGWTSLVPGSLTASPSLNFQLCQTDRAVFATLFSLTGAPVSEPPTRVNQSVSRAIFAWRVGNKRIRIDLNRGEAITVQRRDRTT